MDLDGRHFRAQKSARTPIGVYADESEVELGAEIVIESTEQRACGTAVLEHRDWSVGFRVPAGIEQGLDDRADVAIAASIIVVPRGGQVASIAERPLQPGQAFLERGRLGQRVF